MVPVVLRWILVAGFALAPMKAHATFGACMIMAMQPGIACSIFQTGTATVRVYPTPDQCERKIQEDCRADRDAFFWSHQLELMSCRIQSPQGVLYDGRCLEDLPPGILVPDPAHRITPRVIPPDPWMNYQPSFQELMEWVRAHQRELGWYVMALITAVLIVYVGGNAIAAFFSGGASLATTPATAVVLVAAILGILRSQGVQPSGARAAMESVDLEGGGLTAIGTLPIRPGEEMALTVTLRPAPEAFENSPIYEATVIHRTDETEGESMVEAAGN